MLSFSPLENIITQNAVPFMAGMAVGALGLYVVNWLKQKTVSSEKTMFQILTDEANVGWVSETLTLENFKNKISIKDLNSLRKSVGWAEREKESWEGIFKHSSHILCVLKDKKLIGYGNFVGNGHRGSIFDTHVHPEHQGNNIGTLIMNQLINHAKIEEYTNIGIFAPEEKMKEFYKKFGFKEALGMQCLSKDLTPYFKK